MRGGVRLLLAAFLAAATLGGCAGKSEGEAQTPAAAANTPVGLEVENHGWADVVVYLVRGTAEERLGTVGALNSTVFTFRFHRLGTGNDARLKADPIGERPGLLQRGHPHPAGAVAQVDAGERSVAVVSGRVLTAFENEEAPGGASAGRPLCFSMRCAPDQAVVGSQAVRSNCGLLFSVTGTGKSTIAAVASRPDVRAHREDAGGRTAVLTDQTAHISVTVVCREQPEGPLGEQLIDGLILGGGHGQRIERGRGSQLIELRRHPAIVCRRSAAASASISRASMPSASTMELPSQGT